MSAFKRENSRKDYLARNKEPPPSKLQRSRFAYASDGGVRCYHTRPETPRDLGSPIATSTPRKKPRPSGGPPRLRRRQNRLQNGVNCMISPIPDIDPLPPIGRDNTRGGQPVKKEEEGPLQWFKEMRKKITLKSLF